MPIQSNCDPPVNKPRSAWRRIPVTLRLFLVILIFVGLLGLLSEVAVRELKMRWVSKGMTQAEVEAILGPPNPLPGLKRTRQAFWDANVQFGFKYVSLTVTYNAEGVVESTKRTAFRGTPTWWRTMR